MVADGPDQGQELLTKETLEEARTLTNVGSCRLRDFNPRTAD